MPYSFRELDEMAKTEVLKMKFRVKLWRSADEMQSPKQCTIFSVDVLSFDGGCVDITLKSPDLLVASYLSASNEKINAAISGKGIFPFFVYSLSLVSLSVDSRPDCGNPIVTATLSDRANASPKGAAPCPS